MLRTVGTLFIAVLGSLWAAQLGAQQEPPPTDLPDTPVERAVPPNMRILGSVPQISTPQAPLLVNPPEASTTTWPDGAPAAVTFQWQPGGSSPVTFYIVCVFEADKTCEQPGSETYTVQNTRQSFTPTPGLPLAKFLGKSLKWSVKACLSLSLDPPQVPRAMRPGDPAPPPAPMTPPRCATSAPRTLYWTLPAPIQAGLGRSPGTEPAVLHYSFAWTPVAGARAYLFCLFDGSVSMCTPRTTARSNNPLIVDVGGQSYRVTFDLPQFRGRTIKWSVAACTHWQLDQTPSSPLPDDLRCTWQQQTGGWGTVEIHNPVLAPTINPVGAQVSSSRDNPPSLQLTWTLRRPQDIRYIRVCVLTARGPGGTPVESERRAAVLSSTSPYSCNQRNIIMNPDRPPSTTACTFRRPFLDTGDSDRTVFGFAVAACNEKGTCEYSQPLAVVQDDFAPFGPRAICE